MKFVLMILLFFLLQGCNKPKSVFICGDHECINKLEAEQYFEENLSIEVRIIDSQKKKEIKVNPTLKTQIEKRLTASGSKEKPMPGRSGIKISPSIISIFSLNIYTQASS